MSTNPRNLILLLGFLAAAVGVQSPAEAGFISPALNAGSQDELAAPWQSGDGAGAADPADSDRNETPQVENEAPAKAALFAPAGGSTGSMGAQSGGGGSSSHSLTAAGMADDPASAQLEVWLKVVKQPLHATHLKSRQFRPPRS